MNTAIVLITVLASALRLYQLTRPQYLLGVTEYDDGTDFGSAVRLITATCRTATSSWCSRPGSPC